METLTRRRKIHRAQQAFLRSKSLFRGFVGGRGAGKSWVGAYDVIMRARKGRTYLIGSPTGVLLHDTTYPTFKALAQDVGVWGPVTVEYLPEMVLTPTGEAAVKLRPYPTVRLTTGATVRFRSAEDPEKLRGPNLSGVWLDEASLMEEAAFHVAIACLREGGEQGWLTATFTPKGFGHWTYAVFGGKRPDCERFDADTRENPFNPPGFRDTLAAQYGPQLRRQELGGEFVSIEGAEWPAECFEHGGFWFDRWPTSSEVSWACKTVAIDPSKGRDAKDGDYSAIVKFGVTWDGAEYVEADLARRPVDEICHAAAQAVKDFKPDGLYLEPTAFQELMAPMIRAALKNLDCEVSLHLDLDNAPKQVRIRRLTECIMTKKISFLRNHRGTELCVQQLRDFGPKDDAVHDDGPDALEAARRLAIKLLRKGGG